MRDTRRVVTPAEMEGYFANVDEFWDFTRLPLWGNERFRELPSFQLIDLIGEIPAAQVTLLALSKTNDQVLNGGLEQLFFNCVTDIFLIRNEIQKLGWAELSSRFNEKFEMAFGQGSSRGAEIAGLNASFQDDIRQRASREQTFAHFQRMYDVIDCGDFNTWFYSVAATFRGHIAAFVRNHEAELFIVEPHG